MRASGVLLVLALAACQPEPPLAPEAVPADSASGPLLSAGFVGDSLTAVERRLLWQETQPLLKRFLRDDTVAVVTSAEAETLTGMHGLSASGGRVFSPSEKHLYVRFWAPEDIRDKRFGHLLHIGGILHLPEDSPPVWVQMSSDGWIGWTGDSLRDVNGDAFRDLVVSRYPASGCCVRDVDHVFLYDSASGGFEPHIEFVNAVYLPDLGLARGMEYGHRGETPFYTKRFVGLGVEEVECVYRTPEASTPYAVGGCDRDAPRRGIAEVPAEYDVLERYRDWFEGG